MSAGFEEDRKVILKFRILDDLLGRVALRHRKQRKVLSLSLVKFCNISLGDLRGSFKQSVAPRIAPKIIK